jgi:predicted nucleic acid-binding protein
MKPMNAKIFVDSNVIIYTVGNDKVKKARAKEILKSGPIISTQVMNEIINVMAKKLKIKYPLISDVISKIEDFCKIETIKMKTVRKAISIAEKYRYTYFDSLIIASAIENHCEILYTEDMQSNQKIEADLTLVNPFKGI